MIKIEEENKRNFYLKETINSRWSVRELQRQKAALLYERLALSANKEKVLELAEQGQVLKSGKDLVKDPFVLEFLDIKENTEYLESDLEKNILEHLKEFLLELGKGFMFVGSQVRLTLEEDNETIFSAEYKLNLPTENELIEAVEEEKKNMELMQ